MNEKNEPWDGPRGTPFDILTIDALVYYEAGNPSWLLGSDVCYFEVQKNNFPELALPLMLTVRGRYESDLATPIYSRQIDEWESPLLIPLRSGSYRIEVSTNDEVREMIGIRHNCP